MLFITMFVSMWISNSAATAMMCPVIKGTLEEMSAVSNNIFNIFKISINPTFLQQGVVEMWDTTKVLGPEE